MAYQSLDSREHEALSDSEQSLPASPSHHPPHPLLSSPMEIEAEDRGSDTENHERSPGDRLESMLQSMISAGARYEMVEDYDYEVSERDMELRQEQSPTNSAGDDDEAAVGTPQSRHESIQIPKPVPRPTPIRTVSREGTMRHPTPALQSLREGYAGNIERLERSAERLSMSSDIGEQLRKIQAEQKRSGSRKSSLARTEACAQMPAVPRKFSTSSNASNSILGMNSIARSGGFSPNTYVTSPIGSLRSPSWTHHSIKERSTSHSDRFMTQISEPEREGRPLDSPISVRSTPMVNAPKPPAHASHDMNEEAVYPASYQIPAPSDEPPLDNPQDHHEQMEYPERPPTAASTDTSRQTTNLFADFDGVHITTHRDFSQESQPSLQRHMSLTQAPLVDSSQLHLEPSTEGNMVYYPAPVPMMLNLPQKLSKLPPLNQRDKRRSQMLGTLNVSARKSAAWLPDVLEGDDGEPLPNSASKLDKVDARRSKADLPPQLRASMFFEHQSLRQDVEVKEGSAVATLDSILDASAFAPVSAFTDHPIVGHVGSKIYGRPSTKRNATELSELQVANRKSRNSLNLLKKRHSSSTLLKFDGDRHYSTLSSDNPVRGRDSSAPQPTLNNMQNNAEPAEQYEYDYRLGNPRHNEKIGGNSDEADEFLDAKDDFDTFDQGRNPDEDEDVDAFSGPPTTLLAELQLRKKQQKQRNRTAATAFPQGMHSTLLQLDAVAQIEKQSRKQKHIKLAWEDPDVQHPGRENEDDEDIPLGVLYSREHMANRLPGQLGEDRPLGLIAKRVLEDTEPLSQRRARLRGDPLSRRPGLHQQAISYSLNPPSSQGPLSGKDGGSGDEGESLGQRLRKLKQAPASARPIVGDFASEVMSRFGQSPKIEAPKLQKGEEPEETLGQRRKRLQAERQGPPRQVSGDSGNENTNVDSDIAHPPLKHQRSLADILQAHPIKPGRTLSQQTVPQSTVKGGLLHQHEILKAQSHQRPGDNTKARLLSSSDRRSSIFNQRNPSTNLPEALGVQRPNLSYITNNNVRHSRVHLDLPRNTIPMTHGNLSTGMTNSQGMMPNGSTMILPMVPSEAPSDTKHRNMIDRWRQSVQY